MKMHALALGLLVASASTAAQSASDLVRFDDVPAAAVTFFCGCRAGYAFDGQVYAIGKDRVHYERKKWERVLQYALFVCREDLDAILTAKTLTAP